MLPVAEVDAVLAAVRAQPNVRAASRRINTGGLVTNRDASHTVNITAIEPQIEAPISLAAENLIAGRFLTPEDGDNIVIGKALAEHLDVSVGDRVSLLGRRRDESMRGRASWIGEFHPRWSSPTPPIPPRDCPIPERWIPRIRSATAGHAPDSSLLSRCSRS